MQMDGKETLAQMGGTGLYGAPVYTGTRRITRGQDYIALLVNGRRGYHTWIKTQLMPNDTYTVTLIEIRGTKVEERAKQEDVFCDELKTIIETMYDDHMNRNNGGFIPLS